MRRARKRQRTAAARSLPPQKENRRTDCRRCFYHFPPRRRRGKADNHGPPPPWWARPTPLPAPVTISPWPEAVQRLTMTAVALVGSAAAGGLNIASRRRRAWTLPPRLPAGSFVALRPPTGVPRPPNTASIDVVSAAARRASLSPRGGDKHRAGKIFFVRLILTSCHV